ncbi:gag-pol polyprotein, partial [Lasius niger]
MQTSGRTKQLFTLQIECFWTYLEGFGIHHDTNRSHSVIRGDDSPTNVDSGRLSLPGSPIISGDRSTAIQSGDRLIAEMLWVEVSIEKINAEISNRTASLSELEAATNSALTNLATHHPVRSSLTQQQDPLLLDDVPIPSTGAGVTGKRRAKVSPSAISPSDEEGHGISPSLLGWMRPVTVSLRRLKSAKKRRPSDFVDLIEDRALTDSLPVGTSADAKLESEAELIPPLGESPIKSQTPIRSETPSSSLEKKKRGARKKRPPAKKKVLDSSTTIVSSDEEGDLHIDSDFIPQDLEIMGASALGAMGLNSLKEANDLRGKHGHLNGSISGKIKQRITRAISIMNTLIYKAEAAGDPALLRIKNRELISEITKLKTQDVLMKRELEEMRNMIGGLKNEISELKDKLDETEEDRRKARESHRLAQRKLSILNKETRDGIATTESHEKETPRVINSGLNLPDTRIVDFPPLAGTPVSSATEKLIRERAEIKKHAKEDSGKDSDRRQNSGIPRIMEKPLPQHTPRVRPRVVSSVQLVPPRPSSVAKNKGNKENKGVTSADTGSDRRTNRSDREGWTEVPRKQRRDSGKDRGGQDGSPVPGRQAAKPIDGPNSNRPKAVVRKPPKTAAVMIVGRGDDFSYAEALKKARESISLDALEIDRTKIRRAANGGILIEVLGLGGSGKALALKEKLHDVLRDRAVVSRLVAKGEIRLVGLDCTTSANEVLNVVASLGGCLEDDVKVGAIRPLNNGLYTVWVQCPLGAVAKLSHMRKVKIGWTLARVEALNARPLQCFKCWRFGHLKSSCSFAEDFSGH